MNTQGSHKSTMNILNQPSFEIDGPTHNTRLSSYSIPREMLIISLNKLETDPSTMSTVEVTTKKSVKLSDRSITGSTKAKCILKISQHFLFDKENYPTEGVNTLKDFRDNINDNKYGP